MEVGWQITKVVLAPHVQGVELALALLPEWVSVDQLPSVLQNLAGDGRIVLC